MILEVCISGSLQSTALIFMDRQKINLHSEECTGALLPLTRTVTLCTGKAQKLNVAGVSQSLGGREGREVRRSLWSWLLLTDPMVLTGFAMIPTPGVVTRLALHGTVIAQCGILQEYYKRKWENH